LGGHYDPATVRGGAYLDVSPVDESGAPAVAVVRTRTGEEGIIAETVYDLGTADGNSSSADKSQ
jgi:hypothetical protein